VRAHRSTVIVTVDIPQVEGAVTREYNAAIPSLWFVSLVGIAVRGPTLGTRALLQLGQRPIEPGWRLGVPKAIDLLVLDIQREIVDGPR